MGEVVAVGGIRGAAGKSRDDEGIGHVVGERGPGGEHARRAGRFRERVLAIGGAAGFTLNNSSNNVMVGTYSGYNTALGHNNTFTGSYSGFSNVNGQQNTFIGSSAGYNNTSASHNTFIGRNAERLFSI